MIRQSRFFEKRIYFKDIDDIGRFYKTKDLKLDILFTDKDGIIYRWTPRWRDLAKMIVIARKIEETNKGNSKWNEELKNAENEIISLIEFENKLGELAEFIAGLLGNEYGDKDLKKIISDFGLKYKDKSDLIRYYICTSKNRKELQDRLQLIISNHKNVLRERDEIRIILNRKLDYFDLRIDEDLIVREIKEQERIAHKVDELDEFFMIP